jgi:hypothetical protein
VCARACLCLCLHERVCVCVCVCVSVHICVCVRAWGEVHDHVCACICPLGHACLRLRACVFMSCRKQSVYFVYYLYINPSCTNLRRSNYAASYLNTNIERKCSMAQGFSSDYMTQF